MPRKKQIKQETELKFQPVIEEEAILETEVEIDPSMPLGKILQKARLKQRLKIATVSKKLKIKEIYLEALEEGHYYAFPALVYGVGFLRSYAQFLGLNPAELVQLFHNETTSIKEEPLEMPRAMDTKFMPSAKVMTWSILGLVILYIIVSLIKNLTYQPMEIKPIPTTPVQEETVLQSSESEAINNALPQNQAEEKQEIKKEGKVYGLKTPAHISLVANTSVWVEVRDTDTNRVLLSKVLEVGDQYNPVADPEGLVLKVANPGALDIYQDGQFVKKLDRKDVKKGIPLTDLLKE